MGAWSRGHLQHRPTANHILLTGCERCDRRVVEVNGTGDDPGVRQPTPREPEAVPDLDPASPQGSANPANMESDTGIAGIMYLTTHPVPNHSPLLRCLSGPRQVGETTLLEHCGGGSRHHVALDDLEQREVARCTPRRPPSTKRSTHPSCSTI